MTSILTFTSQDNRPMRRGIPSGLISAQLPEQAVERGLLHFTWVVLLEVGYNMLRRMRRIRCVSRLSLVTYCTAVSALRTMVSRDGQLKPCNHFVKLKQGAWSEPLARFAKMISGLVCRRISWNPAVRTEGFDNSATLQWLHRQHFVHVGHHR